MKKKVEIELKPKDGQRAGCHLYLSSYDADKDKDTIHFLRLDGETDGTFKYVSVAELPDSIYLLTLKVFGSGHSATAEVVGKPEIYLPIDQEWPLSVKVPAHMTRGNAWLYFAHGDTQ